MEEMWGLFACLYLPLGLSYRGPQHWVRSPQIWPKPQNLRLLCRPPQPLPTGPRQ